MKRLAFIVALALALPHNAATSPAVMCAMTLADAAVVAAKIPQRSQHWTDTGLATFGEGKVKRAREIKNWSNWRTPGNGWQASDPAMRASPNQPGGGFNFQRGSEQAPLQVWARDTQPGNSPLVLARRSDTPGSPLNILPRDINVGVDVTWVSDTVFEYVDLWDGTTLRYTVGPHVLQKEIVITNKAIAPTFFEFGYLLPASHTLTVSGNAFTLVRDSDAVELLGSGSPVWGKDSDTDGENLDGSNPIDVTLTDEGSAQGRRVLRITPDADDIAAAVGDIVLDPNVTITGTDGGDMTDDYLSANNPTRNNGSCVNSITGWISSAKRHGLWHLADSAIPAMSECTAAEFRAELNGTVSGVVAVNIEMRRIIAGSWVEGNVCNSNAINDMVDWNHRQHSGPTITWNTGGALGVGTDTATGESETTTTQTSWNDGDIDTWDLNGGDAYDWFEGWGNGTLDNYGVVIVVTSADPAPSNGYFNPKTSENGTGQSSWYLEYTEPVASSAILHGSAF